jgi:acetolactate synthase regulatory subunit
VKIVDGSTVSMPDTKSLQKAFPQQNQQKPGVGFPIARIVVLFCFAYGTVLDAAMGKYQGKATGENKLFRSLDCIEPNDVILGDRFYGSFWELALLDRKGAFGVFRVNASRRIDFRTGERLGVNDHLVVWMKPKKCPSGMDAATYASLPEGLCIREVRFVVEQKGFRTKVVTVATTLYDAKKYSVEMVAKLYYRRWDVELNLRSLKDVLGVDVLRCKSAEMVEKEFWARLLAYNVVRSVLAASAKLFRLGAEQLSFQGARQLLWECSQGVASASAEVREALWQAMLRAVSRHRVGDRPGRVEPRARKRRPKSHPLLQTSRSDARKRLLK